MFFLVVDGRRDGVVAGVFFFSSRRRHTRCGRDWSSYVCSSDLKTAIFDQMSDEHIGYMLSKIPRGRFVNVEEIASVVAFCASQDCSFTTGAVFDISGGRATY